MEDESRSPNIEDHSSNGSPIVSSPLSPIFIRIMVIFLILIASIYLLNIFIEGATTTVSNSKKTEIKVVLPDQSYVWLQQNSNISYSKEFRNIRNVVLKGEALFEVSPLDNVPLTVRTKALELTGKAVKFNVLSSDSLTSVIVLEGHLYIQNNEMPADTIHLVEGEMIRLNEQGERLSKGIADSNMLRPFIEAFHY